MTDFVKHQVNGSTEPQCQFYVVRKKRLCRMTVKPGRSYCGEHEPQPKTDDVQDDTRIPCPNDPKHTCYVRKLQKHLLICNARPVEQPPYIIHNINSPAEEEVHHRLPLSQLPKEAILKVIEKVNTLYEKHIKEHIETAPHFPIHSAVLEEFSESDRTESSLRHLRQVSSLLWLTEREGLVQDNTCYVELGAGKGQLSYYVCRAWCGAGSSAVLVDRASPRHKRDNKLCCGPGRVLRVRADLRHLQLAALDTPRPNQALIGLAKHLCGEATDFAVRGVCGARAARGVLLATCCHHRCTRAAYLANQHLLELGIDGDELNVMLGIVSWATCGDGRSRTRPAGPAGEEDHATPTRESGANSEEHTAREGHGDPAQKDHSAGPEERPGQADRLVLARDYREEVGRRAKRLLDWGRVLYLRDRGFDARLCYYVPSNVSLENVCIIAKKPS